MKLCASRAFWLVAYPSQGHEMLFDAHTRSFAALGGIPRRGIYDNMKTAVDKVKKGQGSSRQRPLRRDVRALPVRRRLLQRGFGLGEGSGREERAGQSAADLDRCCQAALVPSSSSTHGSPIDAGRCGPRSAIPSTSSSACRDARPRTRATDAHARAVRWLNREAGAGVEHMPGGGSAQPLLGALRAGRSDGQHTAVSRRASR